MTNPAGASVRKGTAWLLLGMTCRVLGQAVHFVIIARALGPEGYGGFVGAVALVWILVPFASWGTGHILVREASRNPETLANEWARSLMTTALVGSALFLLALIAGGVILSDVPLAVIAAIAAADLVLSRISDLASQVFQAVERFTFSALFQALPSVLKSLLAVWLVLALDHLTMIVWAAAYLAACSLAALVALAIVRNLFGVSLHTRRTGGWPYRDGLFFSLSLSAHGIYNDIDKAMLARMASHAAAGLYAAAYRVVDVAMTPVRSLLFVTYGRFFRAGVEGMPGSMRLALRFMPIGISYAIVVSAGLVLFAGALPTILGEEYRPSVEALRWLAALPILRVLSSFAADALAGGDRQGVRSVAQLSAAALNIALNLIMIPVWTWRGAVWASLMTEAALAVTLWCIALRGCRSARSVRSEPAVSGASPL